MGFHKSGAPLYLRRFGAQWAGRISGSDSVFIKNQSEPDFGPELPVLPTKHESAQLRPEPGPNPFLRFCVFLETSLAVGSERWPSGPSSGPRPKNVGISCTKKMNSFLHFCLILGRFSKTPLAVGSEGQPDPGPSCTLPARRFKMRHYVNNLGRPSLYI